MMIRILLFLIILIQTSTALVVTVRDEMTGNTVNALIEVMNETWRYSTTGSLNIGLRGEYIVRAYNDSYYSRQLIVDGNETVTLYLLNRTIPSILMEYTLQDLSGSKTNRSMLVVKKANMTIHEAYFYGDKVSVYLDRGSSYKLEVIDSKGVIHDLGWHQPHGDGKDTLTINAITLKPSTLLQTEVKYEIGYSNGRIYLHYNDTLNQTSLVEFFVYNGSTLIYYANSSSPRVNFYYTITNTNGTYFAAFKAQHAKYGLIQEKRVITTSQWKLDLGIPQEHIWLYQALACFLLIFVGMLFGYADSRSGAVIVALLALMFQFIGWLQVPWNILLAAILIAIIAAMGDQN